MSLQVWDLNKDGEWILSGGMSGNISEGHTGVVVRVAWAHPEFGSVLASCSEDHSVIVWKEGSTPLPLSGSLSQSPSLASQS